MVYIPDGDYVGHDSFTFKVSDGKADSKMAKISIRIIADKHGQQIKIPRLKPNLSHDLQNQSQAQNHEQNNNSTSTSSSESQQPDPQDLKNIENQAQNQAQNQESPSKQEQAATSNDNAEIKQ